MVNLIVLIIVEHNVVVYAGSKSIACYSEARQDRVHW